MPDRRRDRFELGWSGTASRQNVETKDRGYQELCSSLDFRWLISKRGQRPSEESSKALPVLGDAVGLVVLLSSEVEHEATTGFVADDPGGHRLQESEYRCPVGVRHFKRREYIGVQSFLVAVDNLIEQLPLGPERVVNRRLADPHGYLKRTGSRAGKSIAPENTYRQVDDLGRVEITGPARGPVG